MKRKRGVSLRKNAVGKKKSVKRLKSNARKNETSGGGNERRIVKRESDCATWSENKDTRSERSEKGMIGTLIERGIERGIETEIETEIETGTGTGIGTEAAIETENENETETEIVTAKEKIHVKRTRFCLRN